MRLEKTVAVLRLARALAGSAEGMTLDEMAASANVSRRTAERMRDAVEGVFGMLEWIDDGRMKRFRIAARGLGSFLVAPTSEELVEVEHAARACDAVRDEARAVVLRSLAQKINANLRDADRRRLSPDVEALLRAEAFARQVGPRPLADPHVLTVLREALLAQRVVTFCYGDGIVCSPREIVPYGIILAPRYYLVGSALGRSDPVLFRLDRIHNVIVTYVRGMPPEKFDLQTYASRSFGVFQEEPEDVVLRFSKSAAQDAKTFLFHPTQAVTDESDGAVTVRFRAGGMLHIAHHLMTWGPTVTILGPQRLQELMAREVDSLQRHYSHFLT